MREGSKLVGAYIWEGNLDEIKVLLVSTITGC